MFRNNHVECFPSKCAFLIAEGGALRITTKSQSLYVFLQEYVNLSLSASVLDKGSRGGVLKAGRGTGWRPKSQHNRTATAMLRGYEAVTVLLVAVASGRRVVERVQVGDVAQSCFRFHSGYRKPSGGPGGASYVHKHCTWLPQRQPCFGMAGAGASVRCAFTCMRQLPRLPDGPRKPNFKRTY
jgi:hypothetical protein